MAVTITKAEPAFRKWTPGVKQGIRYAIAQLEFDAAHAGPVDEDGKPINVGISNQDLTDAASWLRYQMVKHEPGHSGTSPAV